MTPKQALELLEGSYPHRATEAIDTLLAVLRRDWDLRVLDAWARVRGSLWWRSTTETDGRTELDLMFEKGSMDYGGPSPEAAREACARRVYPTLPEEIRAELGERP